MDFIENIEDITTPYINAVITIGNFDGVHKGHQALLEQAIKKAEAINGTSVAITFEPHPLKILGDFSPPLITRRDEKVELITKSGIDVLICINFTKNFASISAKDFIEKILVNIIGMKAVIIGPDYSFGRKRHGDINMMKAEGERLGYEVIVSSWITDTELGTERISSTKIRQMIMEGQVHQVVRYLGRYYQLRGKVIQGRKRGKNLLGIPTANLKLHDELCPKVGIYVVIAETIYGQFPGVANIGFSPTFGDNIFTIEVHLLDFSQDIYDTRIKVNMIARLRDEKPFSSLDELFSQIQTDIINAKEILKENGFT